MEFLIELLYRGLQLNTEKTHLHLLLLSCGHCNYCLLHFPLHHLDYLCICLMYIFLLRSHHPHLLYATSLKIYGFSYYAFLRDYMPQKKVNPLQKTLSSFVKCCLQRITFEGQCSFSCWNSIQWMGQLH